MVIGQGRNPLANPKTRAESDDGFWKNCRKKEANSPSSWEPWGLGSSCWNHSQDAQPHDQHDGTGQVSRHVS